MIFLTIMGRLKAERNKVVDPGYLVAFYCPDTNLRLDGNIPGSKGLGGGKTAIIKMAKALGCAGHNVRVYAYCNEGIFDGIEYLDFGKIRGLTCDVLIAITGHKCDISDLYPEETRARINILWLSGSGFIRGIDKSFFDFYYANSVFLKQRAVTQWALPFEKVIAVHQGYDPEDFGDGTRDGARKPFGFVFASHPHKGLSRTIEIIKRLREDLQERLYLDVYGGWQLWNDSDDREFPAAFPWVHYSGLISQPELCSKLPEYGFMLHLTDYEDTSSILIQQAKRAGVIVIASAVGGNGELLEDGYDGFIIEEDFRDERCYEKVRRLVGYLLGSQEYSEYIRINAKKHPLTWMRAAEGWLEHWGEVFGQTKRKKVLIAGYYGHENLGDETILDCLIRDIRDLGPKTEITVISSDPFYTEKTHGIRALRHEDYASQAKAVEDTDLVILGGGGLYQDHDRIRVAAFFEKEKKVTGYAVVPLISRIWGKPVLYYAHGVGPLFSKEAFVFAKWAFGLADRITVRDEHSFFLLTELLQIDAAKVSLSYDPVIKVGAADVLRCRALQLNCNLPEGKKLVVISVRSWVEKPVEAEMAKSLSLALSEFFVLNPGYHFVFVPFFTAGNAQTNDVGMSEKIAAALPEGSATVIRKYSNYREIMALFRLAEFSIGMRLHSLIFSAVAGTPVVALSYDSKTDEFIKELGCDEFSIELKNITAGLVSEKLNMVRTRPFCGSASIKNIIAARPDSSRVIGELL